ncbi:MAG TPA: hypothetical protein VFT34_05890 [Verrucomicrobiae bacterium]|nr:hypothetical protein [Verrucomicrobiae bacterium]
MNATVLSRLRLRVTAWLTLRGLLVVLAVVAAAALAFLLGDAAMDFSDSTRLAAPWILAGGTLLLLVLAVVPLRRLGDGRIARSFERHDPSLGDRLTNAVQLARKQGGEPVEEFLRREAVELGQRAAAGVRVWPVVRRSIGLASVGAVVIAMGWGAFLILGGDVLQVVLPRFLDPHGDHPPYSRLKIEVTPKNGEVLYGGQLEIKASASGRPVDKLWLVARSDGRAAPTRAIMFLAPDKTFFQTLANLREPTEYFVTDGQARSKRFPIRIRTTPQITMVEVTTEFPSYTGKPTKTGKLMDEPQSFPADTRIRFRVASNRPLQDGKLSLTPVLGGKMVEVLLRPDGTADTAGSVPNAEAPQIVSGAFTLTGLTLFTLSVRDVDGLDCAEPRRGRFNVSPDERPRIAVLEPGRDAVATPSIRIPVKVQAEDDFGITKVLWLRGYNRSIERAFDMKLTQRGSPASVESSGAFDMARLGVRPGDVIEYFFEASDNDPKGPNVALTRPYRLEIISEEQYKQVLLRMAAKKALFEPYFKLGNWLRRLAERAREAERKAANAQTDAEREAAQKEAQELSKELEDYEKALAKLMKSPAMFDVEQEFRDSLGQQQSQIGVAKKKAASASRKPPGVQDLKDLARQLSEMSKQEQENVSQPAQQIAEVARVLARADEFVRMARAQANVAQMLRRFADRQDALSRTEQAEVEELKTQQSNIREALRRYIETMPELLSKVPNDPAYQPLRGDVEEFLKAVAEQKIDQDMADALKNLNERDPGSAHALAQLAAEKMDKLISKCNGLPKQGKQCTSARFQPKLSKASGSLGQILAAMGANGGGEGGEGYGLYGEDVGLYGPDMELAGEQSGGRRDREGSEGSGRSRTVASTAGDSADPALPPPGTPGRVRLQPDAKFPLKYRDLVGEYFRSIAETATESEKGPPR